MTADMEAQVTEQEMVKELRAAIVGGCFDHHDTLMRQAADMIERLVREVARLNHEREHLVDIMGLEWESDMDAIIKAGPKP
jgi:hypothetical protein